MQENLNNQISSFSLGLKIKFHMSYHSNFKKRFNFPLPSFYVVLRYSFTFCCFRLFYIAFSVFGIFLFPYFLFPFSSFLIVPGEKLRSREFKEFA